MSEHARPRPGPCPDDDDLVELALGHADRRAEERLAAHLATCAVCRRAYDDLAGAVELVLPAVPRIAPPPAFETAALDRLARARRTPPDTSSTPPDTSGGGSSTPPDTSGGGVSRRTVLWAAAAAVVGTATGAGVTAYLTRDEPRPRWSTPLLTADGATVGSVSPSYGDQGQLLVIDVSAGPVGRTYTCRLRRTDGTTEDVGEWSLADDRPNSWVVAVPDPGALAAVELVAPSGTVWSTATL